MPDIFLSYSRTDQATARQFAEGFEREGFSVWWDQTLHSGEAYDKVTEKALEEARAVVVLWSKASADSRWVRAEATQADRNGTLVPVMIESCKRPIMFELTHTAELIGWKGDPADKAWQAYLADVRRFVQRDASFPDAVRPVIRRARKLGGLQIAISVAALVVVGALLFWALNRMPGNPEPGPATVSLAVLPFANPDGSEAGRVLAFGVAESILDKLANLKDISVISWDSAIGIGKEARDSHEVAKRLGVAYLLQGSVQRDGEVLRVTARLVEAATQKNVWSLKMERRQQDVFSIQDEIAEQVTRALSVSVSPEGRERMRGQGTRSVEAYLAFLQGMDALSTWRSEEAGKAAAHFNRALQLDPQFARAMVMLVRARMQDAEFAGPYPLSQVEQARVEAAPMIERALMLEPQMGDAYVERAHLLSFDDPAAAEKDYRKAIELSPSNGRAYRQLADLLRDDRARRGELGVLLDRARALDPLDLELDVTRAVYFYYVLAKPEEADLLLRRVLERNPKYLPALTRHGEVLVDGLGRTVEAIKVLETALELDPGSDSTRTFLVLAYVHVGDLARAQKIAEEPEARPVNRLAVALARRHVAEAAQVSYAAIQDGTVPASNEPFVAEAIYLDARSTKDYAKATAALEEMLNISWVSATEPVLGPNIGIVGDDLFYADLLRAAGDKDRALAVLKAVEQTMDRDAADPRFGDAWWNRIGRARAAAMKGDAAAAITGLEQICAVKLCWDALEIDPLFEQLHGMPRFQAMVTSFHQRRDEVRRALQSR